MTYHNKNRFLATLLVTMIAAPLAITPLSATAQLNDNVSKVLVEADALSGDTSISTTAQLNDNGSNVLVGADALSNAYAGDTSIKESRGLLCINKSPLAPLPNTPLTPFNTITPGGAVKDSWSGGRVFVVPNIAGTLLTSRNVADSICKKYGQKVGGARMAEFHDGTSLNSSPAGWSFWADASFANPNDLVVGKSRLWVAINDQNANPWNTTTGKALTFLTIKRL